MYFRSVNTAILEDTIQEFIRNYKEDTTSLAFKGSPFSQISTKELIEQIEGFRKSEKKLPTWHKSKGIYFPQKINLEQTSSEITARYKASLVTGSSLADITGGFGVDAYYFAKQFRQVVHYEQNQRLSAIAAHNFQVLGADHVKTHSGDGVNHVEDQHFDVIYADPARRHASKGKVFFLKDCEPNMVEHLDYLMERCQTLLLKTSPMLDISAALSHLKYVAEIHVVAVKNEVKELLWVLLKGYEGNVDIITKNFGADTNQSFQYEFNKDYPVLYGFPKEFLFEPNAALMKAGNLNALSGAFSLSKLHRHSHLFTSDEAMDFPGRVFRIQEVIPYQKRNMSALKNTKANVTTRNFPENVVSLRKKWRIKDGGSVYLFFTTNKNNELLVLKCQKID